MNAIGDKIVETLYLNRVTSENKRIRTFPCPLHSKLGCLLFSIGSLACVAWRFWLGALSNKVGRGQRNREEIGAEAT